MVTSSSSGKNSCSGTSCPWEDLETGRTAWPDFNAFQQESIVRHYAPKIKYIASRLKCKLPKSIELSELISAGTLGLVEALGKFQPQMGIKFDTYSENRIRGAMLDELRRLDWLPRSLRQRIRHLDEAIQRLGSEHGAPPSEAELSKDTGISIKDIRETMEAMQNQLCLSLDNIQDSLALDEKNIEQDEPYRAVATNDLINKVAALIEQLTPREKLVLSLYYTDELNMRETAEVMGITEGRVSQLHTQALNRLRREFRNQYGNGEL